MTNKITLFSLFAAAFTLLVSCRNAPKRPIPDVSGIKADVQIVRFERELFALDTMHLAQSADALEAKYPIFAKAYFEQATTLRAVFDKPNVKDPKFYGNLGMFLNYAPMRKLYDTTQIAYNDLRDVEQTLSESMRFYKYYFPNRRVPKIYSCLTGFAFGAFVVNDSTLGVSLEMFFGPKCPIYASLPEPIPNFVSRTLDREHLPVYVMQAVVSDLVPEASGSKMLDAMIYEGKKQYVLSEIMPHTADSLRFAYSTPQMKWCNENESDMWKFFLEHKLLYSTTPKEFRRFLDPSPTSSGMPPESPGRTAIYIGYRIVEQYMAANPNLKLADLLKENDAQKIFTASRYKPNR
jgi:hypothetical protein